MLFANNANHGSHQLRSVSSLVEQYEGWTWGFVLELAWWPLLKRPDVESMSVGPED